MEEVARWVLNYRMGLPVKLLPKLVVKSVEVSYSNIGNEMCEEYIRQHGCFHEADLKKKAKDF